MKNYFFICLVLGAFMFSCSEDKTDSGASYQRTKTVQGKSVRSVEEALSIASKAVNLIDGLSTRASLREVDPKNVRIVLQTSTRSTTGGDTLLYVVNYANEQGFAVVSANGDTDGLLAVTNGIQFFSVKM